MGEIIEFRLRCKVCGRSGEVCPQCLVRNIKADLCRARAAVADYLLSQLERESVSP